MARTRIVTGVQVMAAQILVERAERGIDTIDEEILAVANATRVPGTETYEAVYEDQPA
jgi:pyruvate/oxaloacetate carboxyltransferase